MKDKKYHIEEIRQPKNLEGAQDVCYGLSELNFDGNELKPFMPYRLSLILATARKLKCLSMKSC